MQVQDFKNLNLQQAYPFKISPFFQDYILKKGSPKSLTKQFWPDPLELDVIQELGSVDPIGDKLKNTTDKVIHRYKNRVLVTPTTVCPVNCRYCFRKNTLAQNDDVFKGLWANTLNYLKENNEINEVIFTGGDPLMLSDQKIEKYLNDLAQIEHIKFIRFHTRVPIISPDRMSEALSKILNAFAGKFSKILLVIHTNHFDEISDEFINYFKKFSAITNCEFLSQSVLLKDVNDSSDTLFKLFSKLVELNIRPYYLHHPDKVKGGMHFYVPLKIGREIYAKLRDQLSGWALPQYVIDTDNAQGKVSAFNPESFEYSGQLINKNAQLISHLEPNIIVS